MEKLLLVAALACLPGDRLIDLSSKIPREVRSMDFVVSLEPFYTRFYIYQPGFPDSLQRNAYAIFSICLCGPSTPYRRMSLGRASVGRWSAPCSHNWVQGEIELM